MTEKEKDQLKMLRDMIYEANDEVEIQAAASQAHQLLDRVELRTAVSQPPEVIWNWIHHLKGELMDCEDAEECYTYERLIHLLLDHLETMENR